MGVNELAILVDARGEGVGRMGELSALLYTVCGSIHQRLGIAQVLYQLPYKTELRIGFPFSEDVIFSALVKLGWA